MTVAIYSNPDPSSVFSQDGTFTNPFAITFDGRIGGFKETRLFIRNSDPLFYFTDMVLSVEDTNTPNISNNQSEGYVVKLSYGDTKPTYNDWLNIPAANSINIEDLGSLGNPNTSSYLPFWVFIQMPPGIDIRLFTGLKFKVQGNKVLV